MRLQKTCSDPLLLTESLKVVVAQKLIRELCPHCAKPAKPDQKQQEMLNQLHSTLKIDILIKDYTYKIAVGCTECCHIGYKGKIPFFEFLELTPELRSHIQDNADELALRKTVLETEMKPLVLKALEGARRGQISLVDLFLHFKT